MTRLSTQRKNKQSKQGTSGLDSAAISSLNIASVDVYDTLDSLPMTGLSVGTKALVGQNLYFTEGNGWYNIALVNRVPTWDIEPDATYTVEDSATPLLITAKALDSDNPNLINQSVVSDSAQYMVTISNDSSVWTFTPKSADSIGIEVAAGNLTDSNGDFVYTFKWSDGINFVTKAATISYSPAGSTGGPAFYSRLPENWSYSNGQSDSHMRGHSTKQAPDGSYYTVGRNIDGNDSSWLIKRDSTGAFVWIRSWGNANMRANHIVIDTNSNPICISQDYGYYQNAGTGSQTSHIIKFNSSGVEQYKKTFKYNSATTTDHNTYLRSATIDGWDNIWGIFTYNDGVTSPQNYSQDTIGLARIDTSDGSLKKVYTLPPSGTFSKNAATINPIHIDSNNRMYLGWRMDSPTYTSTYWGVVVRMDITENGDPTYVWTKRYGTSNSTQASGHDFAKQISTLSTGEVIVGGYSKVTYKGIPNQYGGTHPFAATLMSLSATDGSLNWGKMLDPVITDDQMSFAVDGQDKIMVSITDQASYGDPIHIREINSSNGAHVNMWDFVNENSTTWRYFIESGTGIQRDNNGNVLITVNPFIAGTSDYHPDLMKLPSTMVTGTFGSTVSGLSGGLTISSNSNTPSYDYSYNPPNQTFSSYSTVTDVTSGFGMYNYNSGSNNDTVSTPTTTVTGDVAVIS